MKCPWCKNGKIVLHTPIIRHTVCGCDLGRQRLSRMRSLAACIQKALYEMVYDSSDSYSFTQQACIALGKKYDISHSEMSSCITSIKYEDIDKLAQEFWADVAHPALLVKEIHDE